MIALEIEEQDEQSLLAVGVLVEQGGELTWVENNEDCIKAVLSRSRYTVIGEPNKDLSLKKVLFFSISNLSVSSSSTSSLPAGSSSSFPSASWRIKKPNLIHFSTQNMLETFQDTVLHIFSSLKIQQEVHFQFLCQGIKEDIIWKKLSFLLTFFSSSSSFFSSAWKKKTYEDG